MNKKVAITLANDDAYVNVAWGLYVKTTLLVHDTAALARYYVKQCQLKEPEATALTTYYQHLDLWFGFPDQLRKHRELVAGLFRCIKFTTLRLESPVFPANDRMVFADALRLELDETFDFVEWCAERGSVSHTESGVLGRVINKGHSKLDRLALA